MASLLWYLTEDLNLFSVFNRSVGLTAKCALMKVSDNVEEDETLSPEVESRTQGSRPRPRTQKKIQGQGRGQPFRGLILSRPRTEMLEAKAKDQGHKRKCSPKKKRSSQKFFRRSPQKNVFQKISQALHKILTIQKVVLSSSRGQTNFRGLEASRPGQGQGLQNVSSRTSSRPKTSSRTPPLIITYSIGCD